MRVNEKSAVKPHKVIKECAFENRKLRTGH